MVNCLRAIAPSQTESVTADCVHNSIELCFVLLQPHNEKQRNKHSAARYCNLRHFTVSWEASALSAAGVHTLRWNPPVSFSSATSNTSWFHSVTMVDSDVSCWTLIAKRLRTVGNTDITVSAVCTVSLQYKAVGLLFFILHESDWSNEVGLQWSHAKCQTVWQNFD